TGNKRVRVNGTLVGDYAREWGEEKKRGGSDGQIIMRLMDAARSRSLREIRHDLYNDLQAIQLSTASQRLKMTNPTMREEIAVIDSSVDAIRAKLGRVSSV